MILTFVLNSNVSEQQWDTFHQDVKKVKTAIRNGGISTRWVITISHFTENNKMCHKGKNYRKKRGEIQTNWPIKFTF